MEILLVVGLVLLGGLAFLVWLCVHVVSLIVRAIFGLSRAGKPPAAAAPAHAVPPGWSSCVHPSCRTASPAHARFCRRCGHAFGSAVRGSSVPMRYVA